MKKHIDISFQGTFSPQRPYRFEAYREASRLNVSGYIRFTSSSSMAIAAEGEEKAVEKFRVWCEMNFSSDGFVKSEEKNGKLMNFKEFRIF